MNFMWIGALLLSLFMFGQSYAKTIQLNANDFKNAKYDVAVKDYRNVYATLSTFGVTKFKSAEDKGVKKIVLNIGGTKQELDLKAPIKDKLQFGPFPLKEAKKITSLINK